MGERDDAWTSKGQKEQFATVLTRHWTSTEWMWGAGVWARALASLKLPATVIVTGKVETTAERLAALGGVRIVYVRVRGWWDWHGWQRLNQKLRQQAAALLLCHGASTTALAATVLSCWHTERPALVAWEAQRVGHGLRGWLLARALRLADGVLLPCRSCAENYLRRGVPYERLICLPPPGDLWPTPHPPTALPVAIPPAASLLLHLCVDEDDYGPRQAIILHDMLRYHRPQLHLLVATASPAQSRRLEAFARRLAFDDLRIHFLQLEQIGPSLLGGRVVLATARQGMASLVITAQYYGAVVAGWRTSETSELVEDGTHGWLATPGRTAELAERVRRLLDQPQHLIQLTSAAQQRARQQWNSHRFRDRLVQLHQDLAGQVQTSRLPVGPSPTDNVPTRLRQHF